MDGEMNVKRDACDVYWKNIRIMRKNMYNDDMNIRKNNMNMKIDCD